MPRAKRYLVEGHTYHLTHRCHDRRPLLRFAKDRDAYREWLRQGAHRYLVPLFGYCVTSNHVHVVVQVDDREAVARMVDLVAGATARQYNRRKGRSGAFWEDSYHATAVESGIHLWRCLRYVDLNMVRAGKVPHPSGWRWCGFRELMGNRRRYRMLDVERLREFLGCPDLEEFRTFYDRYVSDGIRERQCAREPEWTEALAVGSRDYVERFARTTRRTRLQYDRVPGIGTTGEAWMVRESHDSAYTPR
jgi:putative transposase